MKTVIYTAAALLAFAACSAKPGDKTIIKGSFDGEAPDSVVFVMNGVDPVEGTFVVPVSDKNFTAEIPADYYNYAIAQLGEDIDNEYFVSDGTQLVFKVDTAGTVTIKSNNPSKSLHKKFADYLDWNSNFNKTYGERMQALSADASLTEEEKDMEAEHVSDSLSSVFIQYCKKIVDENPDNLMGSIAVEGLISADADVTLIDEAIAKVDSTVASGRYIKSYLKAREAKNGTAEGMMFTDFTVLQDPADPSSEVSFSKYIGRGKYVLVDFWASWCGPCKREIPNIKAVYEKYAGKDFSVLSVAVWDQLEDTKAAAKEHGVVWDQIVNAQRIPTDIYGIEGIPQIMLFGPDGTIIKRDLRGSGIEEEVAKYVTAKK